MKKSILQFSLFTITLITSVQLLAQDKKIEDLNFLYVDEKYDKLVDKSQKLMDDDTYRRHPMPYLYAAMGLYEISKLPEKYSFGERDSDYPKPLKDAEKYMYKYVKYEEKAQKYFPDYEPTKADYKEFFLAIADTANKLGQHLFLVDKPRKAALEYKYAYKAISDDPVLLLWQGICEIKSMNAVEGKKNAMAAMEQIDENFQPSEATAGVISSGMLILEEYFTQEGEMELAAKAKKMVEVFKKYDPEVLDKKKQEEKKQKAKEKDVVMKKFYSDEDDEDNQEIKKGKVVIDKETKSNEDKLDEIDRKSVV